ncbi:DUF4382 domain-containing protein [Alkalimonas delamerensis]|uniref:DUF4382 domain-containing protein n=1 Tax=Alkalimonas delamerensis TaxID=265981 RepID=A0ABT9GMG1_9GAMM|nr:DUF4382 domain-containing protein [Alkalimonas delamerensis]MDP4527980.1 DUF4382 domain-containing protein [Alkalimonas delamerensis]
MMNTNSFRLAAMAAAVSVALVACGNSSEDEAPTQQDPTSAVFSLGVSDAPVTEAAEVVICFSGIELVGNGMPPQRFTLGSDDFTAETNDVCRDEAGNVVPNSRGIDLLTLQGANAEALITGATVSAGSYGQLRLDIADGSYVELLDGSRQPVRVPSNQLRLDGPTLSAGGTFSYTLEFDLRRALVNPVGQPGFIVQPRGLRLVDNSEVGHLEGLVSEGFLLDNQCDVNPADERAAVAAVYLFEGADVALDGMSDNRSDDNASDELQLPYASTGVFFVNDATEYRYSIGFIAAGNYTVAITCDLEDDPEEVDEILFLAAQNISIEAQQQPHQLDF